jgi:hypothetical protein
MKTAINCLFSDELTVRVVDPDPDWIRIKWGAWIRNRIQNPDPDPGARKRRKRKKNLNLYLKISLIL